MADWLDIAVRQLLDINENNEPLATEIQLAVGRIERRPKFGDHVKGHHYVYKDSQNRFRVSYEYNGKSVLVTVIRTL